MRRASFPTRHKRPVSWPAAVAASLAIVASLGACSSSQEYAHVTIGGTPAQASPLHAGDLERGAIAFLTPATVTGQEEDRPALSLVFTQTLAGLRPAVHVVPLDETLSAISHAGVAEAYKQMVADAQASGLLSAVTLAQVSQATGARYLAQLKMAGFQQESQDRFSVFGLRVIQTKKANIRIFLRIWDGRDGAIVWEGAQELYLAKETVSENSISFRDVVAEAARRLVAKLP